MDFIWHKVFSCTKKEGLGPSSAVDKISEKLGKEYDGKPVGKKEDGRSSAKSSATISFTNLISALSNGLQQTDDEPLGDGENVDKDFKKENSLELEEKHELSEGIYNIYIWYIYIYIHN